MGKSYGGSGGITLTEINAHEASYKREFAFTFDGTSLVGASSSGSKATVVLVLDSEIPCSRFAGEAIPDESLKVMLKEKKVFLLLKNCAKDFLLPINPCNWVLACIGGGELLGAGYFDDSADIPGKQVLLFNLSGSEVGGWTLTKTYENGSEFSVVYSSFAGQSVFASEPFSGTWVNASAATFGQFVIRQCSSGNQV